MNDKVLLLKLLGGTVFILVFGWMIAQGLVLMGIDIAAFWVW